MDDFPPFANGGGHHDGPPRRFFVSAYDVHYEEDDDIREHGADVSWFDVEGVELSDDEPLVAAYLEEEAAAVSCSAPAAYLEDYGYSSDEPLAGPSYAEEEEYEAASSSYAEQEEYEAASSAAQLYSADVEAAAVSLVGDGYSSDEEEACLVEFAEVEDEAALSRSFKKALQLATEAFYQDEDDDETMAVELAAQLADEDDALGLERRDAELAVSIAAMQHADEAAAEAEHADEDEAAAMRLAEEEEEAELVEEERLELERRDEDEAAMLADEERRGLEQRDAEMAVALAAMDCDAEIAARFALINEDEDAALAQALKFQQEDEDQDAAIARAMQADNEEARRRRDAEKSRQLAEVRSRLCNEPPPEEQQNAWQQQQRQQRAIMEPPPTLTAAAPAFVPGQPVAAPLPKPVRPQRGALRPWEDESGVGREEVRLLTEAERYARESFAQGGLMSKAQDNMHHYDRERSRTTVADHRRHMLSLRDTSSALYFAAHNSALLGDDACVESAKSFGFAGAEGILQLAVAEGLRPAFAACADVMLDLHKLFVNEAIFALEAALDELVLAQNNPNRTRRARLTVLAGRGRHSDDGVAKIAPRVRELLTRRSDSLLWNEITTGSFNISNRQQSNQHRTYPTSHYQTTASSPHHQNHHHLSSTTGGDTRI